MYVAHCLLLAVVAVAVGAAAVAVVDEAGGGHPEGLQQTGESESTEHDINRH